MLDRLYPRENCSAARALEVVGERWSLLIIRNAAFADCTRFSEFEKSLGIAPNVLTKRLEVFVSDGLMEVEQGDDARTRRYLLTQKGHELAVVVMALTEWGDRWAAPNGPPILFEHNSCGGHVELHTKCAGCGEEPRIDQVLVRPGPGISV